MAETLMEKKEFLMVSPKGGKPTKKITFFIKPTLNFDDTIPQLPSISLPSKPISLKCTFHGWRTPTHDWISWVDRLHSTYKVIWQRAGIYEAILSSRYNIIKNEDLIFCLAERWCCETNTFVFPWGEASVTLEDVLVLGGYSVLGDSVSKSIGKDFDEIFEKLENVHQKLSRGPSQKALQGSWMKYFMKDEGESGVEHEAFLALWLSRFVLPCFPHDVIVKKYFRIAIGLARGVQIALGPLVLASIYRDLSLLKSTLNSDSFIDDLVVLTLWAPLQFVQVWAWERFPVFRPKPGLIECGEPRLARWNGVDKKEVGNVRALLQYFFFENDAFLENCEHKFEWRPYCKDDVNLSLPCLYRETEQVVIVEDGLDDDVRSLVRILKACELLGMDTIEPYNPHRVAMQFGYDLDIPPNIDKGLMGSDLPRREVMQLVWIRYTSAIRDEILYIPPRIYEPQVTVRYLKWLRGGVLTKAAAFDGVLRKKRTSKRSRRSYELPNLKKVTISKGIAELDVKPCSWSKIVGRDLDMVSALSPKYVAPDVGHYADIPSGVMPMTNGHRQEVPSGFCQIPHSAGKDAVAPPKSNFGQVDNAPPGFVPKIGVHNLDVPAGFSLKSNDAGNEPDASPVKTPKSNASRVVNAPPGFLPKTTPLGFTPNLSRLTKSCVQKEDAPPNFTLKTNVRTLDFPSGFRQISGSAGKETDVPTGLAPKSNSGRVLFAPPGFVPKIAKRDLDVLAGFSQKPNATGNDADVIGTPPGFVPKTTGYYLHSPPDFTPNPCLQTESCVQKKEVCAAESKVIVKTEHNHTEMSKLLERYGYDQRLCTAIADIVPKEDVLSRATARESSGSSEQVVARTEQRNGGSAGGITENVSRERKRNAVIGSQTGTNAELAARLRKIHRMVVEHTKAN